MSELTKEALATELERLLPVAAGPFVLALSSREGSAARHATVIDRDGALAVVLRLDTFSDDARADLIHQATMPDGVVVVPAAARKDSSRVQRYLRGWVDALRASLPAVPAVARDWGAFMPFDFAASEALEGASSTESEFRDVIHAQLASRLVVAGGDEEEDEWMVETRPASRP